MDLTIPMGWKYRSKEIVEMVKEHEDKYAWAKKTSRTSLEAVW